MELSDLSTAIVKESEQRRRQMLQTLTDSKHNIVGADSGSDDVSTKENKVGLFVLVYFIIITLIIIIKVNEKNKVRHICVVVRLVIVLRPVKQQEICNLEWK